MKSAFFLEHFASGSLFCYLHPLGISSPALPSFPHLSYRELLPMSMNIESGEGIPPEETASAGQLK